jgi:UDP-glucose 4-epimerase
MLGHVMNLKNKKILLIGGAGNIGSHLAELLHEKEASLTIMDNFVRGKTENISALEGKVEIIEGDIRDTKAIQDAVKNQEFVFLLASVWLLECLNNPRLSLDVNVTGTFNVLEACHEAKIQKLIFSSSASVFGDPSYVPVDENHPFNTNSAYGASKVSGEQYCELFHQRYGLSYVALRYFNVYGPRQDIKGAFTQILPKWADAIEKDEPITIYGDGEQTMDMIFVRDVAQSNICALESSVNSGCYNIGTGVETSVNKLAEVLMSLMKKKVEIKHVPQDLNLVRRRLCSIEKSKKDLNFVAKTSLEDGLKAFLSWRKSQLQLKL